MSDENKNSTFDLAALDTTENAETGAWMHLQGPDYEDLYVGEKDDGKPVRILLLGADSKEFQQLQHKQTTKRVKQLTKPGRRSRNELSSEDFTEGSIDLLVRCTKGFENVIYNGEELDCTAANARKIYERLGFVREQAWDFINDRSNYLGNSSST